MLSLSQYVFFHQFACNHQLIFDYSTVYDEITTSHWKVPQFLILCSWFLNLHIITCQVKKIHHDIFKKSHCMFLPLVRVLSFIGSQKLVSACWGSNRLVPPIIPNHQHRNLHLYLQHEQQDGNQWAPARGSLNR